MPVPVPSSTHPNIDALMNEEVEKDRAPRRLVHFIAAAFGGLVRAHLSEPGNFDDELQAQFKEPLKPGVTNNAPTKEEIIPVKTHLYALLLDLSKVLRLNSICLINALILVERAIRAGLSFRISTCRRIIVAALMLSTKEHFDEVMITSYFKRALAAKLGSSWQELGTSLPTLERVFFGPVLDYHASVSLEVCEQYCQTLRQLMLES